MKNCGLAVDHAGHSIALRLDSAGGVGQATSLPTQSRTSSDVNAIMALQTMHASPHKEDALHHLYADMEFFDDVTGKTLSHAMTVEARKLEMKFFRKMGVYTKIPSSEALANGCRVMTNRWLVGY